MSNPTKIVGQKGSLRLATDWGRCSDRLHIIPGKCNFTDGWVLFYLEGKEDSA